MSLLPTLSRIDASTSRIWPVTLSRMRSGDRTAAPDGAKLSSRAAANRSKS
jgi:hypothetical protein